MIHERGFIFSQRRKERKGIPTECWTWRLGERWFTQEDLFSRKGAKNAKDSYGMLDLADLAAWREMVHARDLFSRKGAKNAKDSYGVPNLPDLAAWREMVHARDLFSRKGAKNGKRLGITIFQPRLKVCTFARTNYY